MKTQLVYAALILFSMQTLLCMHRQFDNAIENPSDQFIKRRADFEKQLTETQVAAEKIQATRSLLKQEEKALILDRMKQEQKGTCPFMLRHVLLANEAKENLPKDCLPKGCILLGAAIQNEETALFTYRKIGILIQWKDESGAPLIKYDVYTKRLVGLGGAGLLCTSLLAALAGINYFTFPYIVQHGQRFQ